MDTLGVLSGVSSAIAIASMATYHLRLRHYLVSAGGDLRRVPRLNDVEHATSRLGAGIGLDARCAQPETFEDGYIHYPSVVPHTLAQLALKRGLDIVASLTALVLLAPLLTIVAVLVKVTSRGPVFFRQVRVGLRGRPFKMLKFRSMITNAEDLAARLAAFSEQGAPVFRIRKDPRITIVGAFIRRYSIDELPQLINVLRGDMSIVGPRPPIPSEVAKYETWQRRRLSVRPGLTCVWQVSGRNEITFEEWMFLDMQYVEHWSFLQDVKLILKTVPVVLGGTVPVRLARDSSPLAKPRRT